MKTQINLKTEPGPLYDRLLDYPAPEATLYTLYTREDLDQDLEQIEKPQTDFKQGYLKQAVKTLKEGDLIVSLQNLSAALVSAQNAGKILTSNYVKVTPPESLDTAYLMYLINEDDKLRKSILMDAPGVFSKKPSLKALKSITVENLPDLETQKVIGQIYLAGKKKKALQKEKADLEEILLLERIKRL